MRHFWFSACIAIFVLGCSFLKDSSVRGIPPQKKCLVLRITTDLYLLDKARRSDYSSELDEAVERMNEQEWYAYFAREVSTYYLCPEGMYFEWLELIEKLGHLPPVAARAAVRAAWDFLLFHPLFQMNGDYTSILRRCSGGSDYGTVRSTFIRLVQIAERISRKDAHDELGSLLISRKLTLAMIDTVLAAVSTSNEDKNTDLYVWLKQCSSDQKLPALLREEAKKALERCCLVTSK